MQQCLNTIITKPLVLILIAKVFILGACQTQSPANLVSDMTVSNQMIQGIEFETHCIGRYQIQMIKGLAPRSVIAKFDGFKIVRLSTKPVKDLASLVEQKKIDEEVGKNYGDYVAELYEEKIVGNHSAFYIYKTVPGAIRIRFFKNIATGTYEFTTINDLEYYDHFKKRTISILNNMKPLEGPPTQPGFCLPGAIIHLDPGELRESSHIGFIGFPEENNVWRLKMTGFISSEGENYSPSVREKGRAQYNPLLLEEEGYSFDDYEIRFRRVRVNSHPGYEWLGGFETKGQYDFSWRAWGQQGNVQEPEIVLSYRVNQKHPMPKHYTQEQVIAIWERILSSVKLHAGEQTRTIGKPK